MDFLTYKTDGGYVEIPALLEWHSDLGGYSVTFERLLNEYAGSYEPCVIRVPEDLKPELAENVYGEKMLVLNGLSWQLNLSSRFCEAPLIRIPVSDEGGKQYAYINLDRNKLDKDGEPVKTAAVRARFEIIK